MNKKDLLNELVVVFCYSVEDNMIDIVNNMDIKFKLVKFTTTRSYYTPDMEGSNVEYQLYAYLDDIITKPYIKDFCLNNLFGYYSKNDLEELVSYLSMYESNIAGDKYLQAADNMFSFYQDNKQNIYKKVYAELYESLEDRISYLERP